MKKADLVEFFKMLYRGQQAGSIEIRLLPSSKKIWLPWPIFEEHPSLDQLKPPFKQDTYIGVNLRKEGSETGTDDDCLISPILRIDLDLKDFPERTGGQTKDSILKADKDELMGYKIELYEDVLGICKAHNLPPFCIIDSGHGIQVYWRRAAGTDHEDTRRLNKKLIKLFNGEKNAFDVARILRLPYTRNLKNRRRPLEVGILYKDLEAVVNDSDLEPLPDPEKEKPLIREDLVPFSPSQPCAGNLNAKEAYAENALKRECEQLAAMPPDSGRNDQLNTAAHNMGTLVAAGAISEQRVRSELAAAANASGLEPPEIPPTINSGLKAGMAKPRDMSSIGTGFTGGAKATLKGMGITKATTGVLTAPERQKTSKKPPAPTLGEYRDLFMGHLKKVDEIYKYHQIWRSWWVYKDGVYEEVPDEVIYQKIDRALEKLGFDDLSTPQLKYVLDKFSRHEEVGLVKTTQKSHELNTKNGILNLESMGFKPHTPDYFSIIQSEAEYQPEAVAHHWLRFLHEAVPSEDDRQVLKQYAGLCLTGDTTPQKALLLVGDGGTGKSTFSSVISAVLGNLATSSAIQNIQDGSFLVGQLVGKRMCVVSELPRMFDWIPFKRVTGEDKITVDVKHKAPFSEKLDIKFIILSNVVPHLGDDSANSSVIRRLLTVEFNVKPTEPDTGLYARLTQPSELSGVLNWMLEGLAELRANGMRFPSGRNDLADEIIEESNRVITFLREKCALGGDFGIKGADLYRVYEAWCFDNGNKPLANNNFGKQLVAAGNFLESSIQKKKKRDGIHWEGVGLVKGEMVGKSSR